MGCARTESGPGVQGVRWSWSVPALRSEGHNVPGLSLPQRNDRKGLSHIHKATVMLVAPRIPLTQQMRLGPASLLQVPPELSLLSPLPGCPGAMLQEGL